jgi:hypothetical protein
MAIFYRLRFETPPTWRARSPYLYPPGAGWPSYTPRYWVPFSSPPTTRRATVASTRASVYSVILHSLYPQYVLYYTSAQNAHQQRCSSAAVWIFPPFVAFPSGSQRYRHTGQTPRVSTASRHRSCITDRLFFFGAFSRRSNRVKCVRHSVITTQNI